MVIRFSPDLTARHAARRVAWSVTLLACALLLHGCSGGGTPDERPADDKGTGQPSPGAGPIDEPNRPAPENPGLDAPAPGDPPPSLRDYARYDGEGDLPPLPAPPLTPPPDVTSEPIVETRPVSTAQGFTVMADPHGRITDPDKPVLGDADFEAGLPPPTVRVLPGAVIEGNTLPRFIGLSNRDVLAGEVLEIVLDPDDPDGGFAGMFPEHLPPGAEYIDNFDGTRSLRWRPLQPDVGVRSFTIVAVDATEPGYRLAQPVLIRVSLPPDPSGIRNLAPGINEVRPSVARVGDPVVLELKVTDPNGTEPRLLLPNRPAGSTLVPHRSEPGMSVLRYVPQRAGTLSLRVQAQDAEDASMVTEKRVIVDVLPRDAFTLPGERLRDLATAHGLRMGFAAVRGFHHKPDGALYADLAGAEFDLVTSENSLKADGLNPVPGIWRWAGADNLVAWAESEELDVRGHTLVWHRQLPDWLKRSDPSQREGHLREFIDRVMRRYAGRIAMWDVVNEAFEDDGRYRDSIWHEAMGERYIDIAFRQARLSDPAANLVYNDYDVAFEGPKADAMFEMLAGLRERQVPIDGVGFQVHVFADFDAFDEFSRNLARAEALGLEAWITELDVSLDGDQTEAQQARVYAGILAACLQAPNCRGLQTWGFTDRYSWRRQYTPLPFDARYTPKPAYRALQDELVGG